ncbi:four helix bundle protein [Catalinimonas alkaloidigena]|uniref:Four helix bundle protein n=1 Tax=Catalinimonas alkaloidigena TaxID=1075417 RepID=A0A1G9H7S8_9BACT|nr:four helix bundle protein [Catalinimonas alkaloidigena]SDL09078.1 four helix bundle protein [Catalinimonas alkaloidigena]
MAKIQRFEDLDVWKEGVQLSVAMYKALAGCRDFGLRDQMQRASVSVPSNIAEGFERNSNQDFVRFLTIARASCGELRTQLYIAIDIGILSPEVGGALIAHTRKVSAMLSKYIQIRKEHF